tara:strand:- start:715 stop:2832 length:2118 start_codon:yes stop_codon:yes gene_type:complete
MAKDDNKQGNSLLGSIVSELKQLNRASVKDKLRDAEALKRAESLAASQVIQAQESGAIVTDAQDFQRRFLAGQSRTEFNAAIKDRPAKYFAQQTLIRHSEIQTEYLKDISAMATQGVIENYHFLNEISELISKRWTSSKPAKPASSSTGGTGGFSSEMLASVNLVKVNSDALVQTSSKIKNINHQILDFLKADKLDRLQQFNTSQRSAEEARREAIKNAGRGSGTGMPTGGSGTDEEEGGFFKSIMNSSWIKNLPAGLVGLFGIRKAFKSKWFKRQIKARWRLAGRKMFPKAKGKVSGNPRLWPLLLAGFVISSFSSGAEAAMSDVDTEQSDTADGSAGLNADGSVDSSIFTVDNAINAALIATMLPLKSMTTRITTGVKLGLTKFFKGAGKNTLKGKMWAKMAGSTGWKLTGRGFLRAFGPWGLAAWAVTEIVIWRLNAIEQQQILNNDLMADMNAVDSEASAGDFMANADMSMFKFKEQRSMMLANPNTKQKNNVKMLLSTVAKNKAAQEVYIQELMKQGWDEKTLRGMAASINNPSSTMTSSVNTDHAAYKKQQKLLEEKSRQEMMGGLSLWTKDYAPMDLMDDSIQYGTGVGVYGNGGDQIMGGAVYGPVNNIHNETVYIIPPKENIHKPGGFSDIRLKEDIKLIGKSPSDINIYEFKYIGEEGKYEGVMAQEVPWASSIADNGFLWVDYTKLDVDFIRLN